MAAVDTMESSGAALNQTGSIRNRSNDKMVRKLKACVFALLLLLTLLVLVFLILYFCFFHDCMEPSAPSRDSTAARSPSKLGVYRSAAVCADAGICATVGRSIMEQGGNAVDAVIATLLCDGVANPHSMGIGGGFTMTLYNRSTGIAQALIARERAPAAANVEMHSSTYETRTGALAIAVPGEIPGYWAAHQRYGSLPWGQLFEPAITMLRFGSPVTDTVYQALHNSTVQQVLANESFALGDIFLKDDNRTLRKGELIRRPVLASTLEKIADGGIQAYNDLGVKLAQDIRELGGVITKEDIANYKAEWMEPIAVALPMTGVTLYSVPPPASGAVIASILGTLDAYKLNNDSMASVEQRAETLHLMAEAFKFAYAQRGRLGDPEFVKMDQIVHNMTSAEYLVDVRRRLSLSSVLDSPEAYGAVFQNNNDSGTAHISVVDQDGSAVSVTSTVNFYFGSGVRSRQTGIILNDQMADYSSRFSNFFGLPPSPLNFIAPGKRSVSSMAPTILVNDDGSVRLVIGASGGSKITSVTAYVLARNLWLGDNIKEAVDAKRIHHQLIPNVLKVENGMDQSLLEKLRARGQNVHESGYLARVCGIARTPKGHLEANADYRKGGDVAGF